MYRLKILFEQAVECGCIYAAVENDIIKAQFDDLLENSHGDPCTSNMYSPNGECPDFQDGKCPCYQRYHTRAIAKRQGDAMSIQQRQERQHWERTTHGGAISGQWVGKTIRQIAEQEGISISEARRRKVAGAYKD